ncbi:MAG TPA: hypothetical protein VF294_01495 [Polyangiaceae bacterium]
MSDTIANYARDFSGAVRTSPNPAIAGVFDAGVAPPAGMAPQRLYVDSVRVFRK